MNTSKPPVLVTWLLRTLRFNNTDDALAGDLLEEYRLGRSKTWYCRQALFAILLSFASEVRNHWVLAIRATAIGLTTSYLISMFGHFVIVELLRSLYRSHIIDVSSIPRLIPWIVNSFFAGVVSGWIVAFLHRRHRNTILLVLAVAFVIWAGMLRGISLIEPNFGRFVVMAVTFYISTVAGIFAGGFLISPMRENGPISERPGASVL